MVLGGGQFLMSEVPLYTLNVTAPPQALFDASGLTVIQRGAGYLWKHLRFISSLGLNSAFAPSGNLVKASSKA